MASDRARVERAAARYGRSVDHIAARYTNPVTGKRLTGEALLLKTAQGESSALTSDKARSDVSPAGARGWAQFMPSSRAVVLKKFGVDPWKSPEEAIHGMALHLRGKVNGSAGLEGYNPGGGQGYVDYILRQKVGRTSGGSRSSSGGAPAPTYASGGTSAPAQVTVSGAGFNPGAVATPQAAAPAVTMPAQISSAPLTPPPNTPGPTMPKAYRALIAGSVTPPQTGEPQVPAPDPVTLPNVSVSVKDGAAPASSSSRSGGGGGPFRGARGSIIGTPYNGGTRERPGEGTHNLGNWQSDNAVDLSVPNGTIVTALRDGVVEKVKGGYSGGSSRFDGYQVTIRFKDGNRAFYTHLSKTHVKPGTRLRAGQALGRSGSANGVPHLHLGVERGDPRALLGSGGRSSSSGGGGSRRGLPSRIEHAGGYLERRIGLPVTARQEPGHESGGDHDPAVRGATARDFGGSESQRKAAWTKLMRDLGVRGATFGGADVNVVKNGLRYQVISRPHGTGPHLHVGVRRA